MGKKEHTSPALHLCPPASKLNLYQNYNYFPHHDLILEVKPNYDIVKNKTLVDVEVEKFVMGRYQLDSSTDL